MRPGPPRGLLVSSEASAQGTGACFVLNLKSLLNAAADAANRNLAFTLNPHSRFMEMMSVGTI